MLEEKKKELQAANLQLSLSEVSTNISGAYWNTGGLSVHCPAFKKTSETSKVLMGCQVHSQETLHCNSPTVHRGRALKEAPAE